MDEVKRELTREELLELLKKEIRIYKNCYEQVKRERDLFEEDLQTAKAEIERLTSMNQAKLDMIHDLRAELETAKAEAIKEFAEKLKKKAICIGEGEDILWVEHIDNLVKEMVGDNDD